MRRKGAAHCPTKRAAWSLPAALRASEVTMEPTAAASQELDGAWADCFSRNEVIWSSRISPRRTRWSIVSLRFQKLACLQVGCGAAGRAGCELPGVQAGSAGVAWEEKAVEGYGK